MQKKFVGEIIELGENNFNNAAGEVVELLRLAVQTTDDKGMVFNVPKNTPLFEKLLEFVIGQKVVCTSHSTITNDGRVKWKLDEIEPQD